MVKFEGIDPVPKESDACGVPRTEHTGAVAPFPDSQIVENPYFALKATPCRPLPDTSAQVTLTGLNDSYVYRA